MRKNEIQIGGKYVAKISGALVVVRIDKEHASGGWVATNMETNKPVRIRSAGKLRRQSLPGETGDGPEPRQVAGRIASKTASKATAVKHEAKTRKSRADIDKPRDKTAKPQPARRRGRVATKPQPQKIKIAKGETFAVRSGKEYVIQMTNDSIVYARQIRGGTPAGPTRPFDRKSIEAGFPRGTRGAESPYPESQCLDAAATVLREAKEPMDAKQIMTEIRKRKLWFTSGRTPHITLAAAMGRDIRRGLRAGKHASRFERAGRGYFQLRQKRAPKTPAKTNKKAPKK